MTMTKGEGLMSSLFHGYIDYLGPMRHRKYGSLVADRTGQCTEYSLSTLQERGILFVGPQTEVYEGMIIGECSGNNDMNVNPIKGKKLTNVRSVNSDGITILKGLRHLSLEDYMEWIDDDEWIECTPQNIRIRKNYINLKIFSLVKDFCTSSR